MTADKRLKVLILSHMFPNAKSPSSGRFVAEQSRALSEFVDIKVISPVPTAPFIKYLPGYSAYAAIPRRIDYEGIDVHFPRYFLLPKLFSISNWTFPAAVKKTLATIYREFPFDVIHAHTVFPDGYAAVRAAADFRCPVVITAHGYDIYDIPWRNRIFLHSCREAIAKSDRLLAVGKSLLPDLIKLGARDDQATIIPNGVAPELFFPRDTLACRRELGLPEEKRIILCVANLFEIKGVEHLLRAFAEARPELPDTALFIVGDGPLFPRLERLRKDLGLEGSAFLVGTKAHSDLPAWFNAADLVALPSLNESFGIVLIEAMACGKPIVASNVGGIPEIVTDEEVGLLVEPANSAALAGAVVKALNRDWDHELIAARAKKYSMVSVAERLTEVYTQLAGLKFVSN